MLTQEQLIIKLLWEEELSIEEKENLKRDSLTLSFIAKAIEKHLEEVKFLPNDSIKIGGPRVEDACLEFRHKKHIIPFIDFKFVRKSYIVHELGWHGEKRKKTYKNLLSALKYYIRAISFHHHDIGDLKIKT